MYKITIPTNEGYTGIVAGVPFIDGEGTTKDNWLADWFIENGYKVEKVEEDKQGEPGQPVNLNDLTVEKLKQLAKEKGIEGISNMRKEDLIQAISGE